jgi:hypothetical protein
MISRTSDNQSWPDGVAIELEEVTDVYLDGGKKMRRSKRLIEDQECRELAAQRAEESKHANQ